MIAIWMRRLIVLGMLAWIVYALAVWAPATAKGDDGTTTTSTDTVPATTVTVTVTTPAPTVIPAPPVIVSTYAGHTAHGWHDRYLAQRHRTTSLKRTLLARPNVTEAIDLACAVYGNCATLWRRARCESHLYRFAQNASGASGLLQFLPSTWRTTPFARFNIFSAYANALAAGWMLQRGRGNEWSCR